MTLWTAALQVSLSFTISQSLLKLMSIESVMPSNYLILCQPFLLLTSIFLSIREPEASATCSPNFLAFYHCMLTFLEKPLHASFIWINPRRSSMLNLGVPYSRKPSLMPRLLGCLFLLLLLFFSLFFSFLFLFYVLFFFNFFSCCIYFFYFFIFSFLFLKF